MQIFSKFQIVGGSFAAIWPELKYRFLQTYGDVRAFVLAPWRFIQNVWRFRKELWNFRRFDYSFNLSLFKKSLALTADFLESDDVVSSFTKEDAAQIRKFIKYLDINENPELEAERILGVDYLELSKKVYGNDGCNFTWTNKPQEEWTPEQLQLHEMHNLIHTLEERSWKNAWKLISRRGRRWWD